MLPKTPGLNQYNRSREPGRMVDGTSRYSIQGDFKTFKDVVYWYKEFRDWLVPVSFIQPETCPILFTIPESNGSLPMIIIFYIDNGLFIAHQKVHLAYSKILPSYSSWVPISKNPPRQSEQYHNTPSEMYHIHCGVLLRWSGSETS
jgi:hypothetical protein